MSHRSLLLLSLLILFFISTPVSAHEMNPAGDKPAPLETVTRTNGFYDIFVQDVNSQIGTYTVRTGANHPVTSEAGSPQNVLFGGTSGSPWSSFNTIRSYTTNTDYVPGPGHISDFSVTDLDAYSTGTTFYGNTGIRTTWVLPGPPTTADKLNITQEIEIVGATFTDSSVKVTVQITNPNFSPVDVGVRYLWDWEIGLDDGPTFTQSYPSGSPLTNEIAFQPPGFVVYRMQDNDINTSSPLFGIYGSATPPLGVGSDITPPGKLQYVCWPDAYIPAFNYTVNPNRDIATTSSACSGSSGGDTGVTYVYGADATNALRIGSNETLTIVAYLLAASPLDTDNDGLIDTWETNDTDLNGDGVIDVGPSVGSDPNRKDIYVEVDWMEDSNHSHNPNPDAIRKIVESFAAHDINLHVDAGPNSIDYVTGNSWGQNSKGNAITHKDTVGVPSNSEELGDEWTALVNANFGHSDRAYRHALFIHRISCYGCSKALGVGIRQTLLVALGTQKDGIGTLNEQAGTFMHELGHTLNLWHGGSKDQAGIDYNFKPNYLSVMNYSFTTGGLIVNGTDGNFNYSEVQLPNLNEADLVEADGLNDVRVSDYSTKYNISSPWACFTDAEQFGDGYYVISDDKPIDWSCNGQIDTGSVHDDINGIGGASQQLPGWDDWSHLDFKMGNIGFLGYTNPIIITPEDIEQYAVGELTAEQDLRIQRLSDPRVQLSKTVNSPGVQPGGLVTYTITMRNIDGQNSNDVVITDTLPAGFTYVTGSTSGATTNDPVIDGQNLTWSPFVVPANGGVLTLTFQATASQVPGTYFNNVSGDSTNAFVVPTGDTAQVEVVSSPIPTNTPTATPSPTATQTGGTFTFTPVADAYVSADTPTTNYGTSTTLRADASPIVRSYLRFDVQGLSGAVTRATLRVYANSSSSQGYQVMPVSDNTWAENTISYNNMPSIGASLGSSGTFGAGVWTTVDVTSYITGNGVFNIALSTTSNTAISLASRESGANAPQLVIETTGGPTITPTFTPTITATPTSPFTPTPTATATLTPTPPTAGSPFYLSLSGQATLGGVTGEDTDIFYYNGTTWSLFFDASDVGVTDSGNDLNDFYIADADTILVTFRDPITLGSLAVDPYDVVQFDATSLGDTTAGTFSLYFDGSDVGLDDPVAEMLNGFDLLPDGRLLFSTDGNFTVPGLTGKDEDIFAFTPTTLGETTSGTWTMYFDGSLAGIGLGDTGEDVDMVDVPANGDIYLSAESTFAVPGIAGEDEDIFVCTPTFTSGAVSSCAYSSTLFFDGSAWGLDTNDVDALYLP